MKIKCSYEDSYDNKRIIKLKDSSFKSMQREFKDLSKKELYKLSELVQDKLYIELLRIGLTRTIDLGITYHYKYKRIRVMIYLLDRSFVSCLVENLFIHRDKNIAKDQVQETIYKQTGYLINPNYLLCFDNYISVRELLQEVCQTKSARNI